MLSSPSNTEHVSDKLPVRADISQGTLANGMQYIVLENDKPADQISLQLVVKAGSLHEQDDQQGIAHLVEHMAFNGTQQYPGNSIIERQESLGMVFGRDVNATTSFHTTTYFLHLPNNTPALLDEAFNMLAQQASALTFEPQELEKERPVVEEEWRKNLNIRNRLATATGAITKANSRYSKRLPIGDMELVRHVDAQRIKAFWQDWYHPNNMVLIAVGATNEQQIVSALKKYFDKMPAVKLPPQPNTDIPILNSMSFNVVSDPELNTELMTINFRAKQPVVETIEGAKQQLISDLAVYLMSDRLRQHFESGGLYISKMSVAAYDLAQGYSNTRMFAILKDEQYSKALQEMFAEISRHVAHGFSASELDSVKLMLQKSYQARIENLASITNKSLLSTLYNQLLNHAPFVSRLDQATLTQRLLNEITLADVNQYLPNLLSQRTAAVIAQVKSDNKEKLPTLQQVKGFWQQAIATPPPPSEEVNVDAPLFNKELPNVEVISHKMLGENHIWTLKNDVEVWFQPSDKTPDSLLIRWQGLGGTAHLPKSEQRIAQLAVSSMARFGYANFNVFQLERLNAGKNFNLGATVSQLQHLVTGSATKDSLEAWLQNFYLKITTPRVDDAIWQSNKALLLKSLNAEHKSPQRQFQQALSAVLYPRDSILQPLSTSDVEQISSDMLLPVWQKVFNHSAKHQLLIVGNADPQWVISTAAKYVGNLPVGEVKGELQLAKIAPKKNTVIVHAGTEPKATTELFWLIDYPYQLKTKRAANIVGKLINIRMREQLREVAGGVYASQFSFSVDRTREQLSASLSYSHQPEREQELKHIAMQVIQNVIHNGFTQIELNTVKEQVQNALKVDNIRDSQKLSWMSQFARLNEYQPMPDHYLAWLKSVSVEELNILAKALLSSEPKVEAILQPKQKLQETI
ncbi:insulinase family protein [Pseudoalteromonas sp. MMG010]|uniref:M16 family metallopeptidase n=1 Tax=Pseudoalteromonas sp. MMG010 TaxID=2822685 RepID=UPI001B39F896|nr:M16 family metallopeptidase [Pseudoalteromonas sp. MMG010]MBQ4832121.1 insulinase family protein [Pseudoalteromonas sp. MMG010]